MSFERRSFERSRELISKDAHERTTKVNSVGQRKTTEVNSSSKTINSAGGNGSIARHGDQKDAFVGPRRKKTIRRVRIVDGHRNGASAARAWTAHPSDGTEGFVHVQSRRLVRSTCCTFPTIASLRRADGPRLSRFERSERLGHVWRTTHQVLPPLQGFLGSGTLGPFRIVYGCVRTYERCPPIRRMLWPSSPRTTRRSAVARTQLRASAEEELGGSIRERTGRIPEFLCGKSVFSPPEPELLRPCVGSICHVS